METKFRTIVLFFLTCLASSQAIHTSGSSITLMTPQFKLLSVVQPIELQLRNQLVTGSIVLLEDDETLKVTTNGGALIEEVVIYSGTTIITSFSGCGGTQCEYNLSSLSAGNYSVHVFTNQGTFIGSITKK